MRPSRPLMTSSPSTPRDFHSERAVAAANVTASACLPWTARRSPSMVTFQCSLHSGQATYGHESGYVFGAHGGAVRGRRRPVLAQRHRALLQGFVSAGTLGAVQHLLHARLEGVQLAVRQVLGRLGDALLVR